MVYRRCRRTDSTAREAIDRYALLHTIFNSLTLIYHSVKCYEAAMPTSVAARNTISIDFVEWVVLFPSISFIVRSPQFHCVGNSKCVFFCCYCMCMWRGRPQFSFNQSKNENEQCRNPLTRGHLIAMVLINCWHWDWMRQMGEPNGRTKQRIDDRFDRILAMYHGNMPHQKLIALHFNCEW